MYEGRIVENEEQLEKFLAVRDRVPEVAKCIVIDRDGLHDFSDGQVLFLDELYDAGRRVHESDRDRFRREVEASRPDDVALLVYTSGTTGPPKGVMITHENVRHGGVSLPGARASRASIRHGRLQPLPALGRGRYRPRHRLRPPARPDRRRVQPWRKTCPAPGKPDHREREDSRVSARC